MNRFHRLLCAVRLYPSFMRLIHRFDYHYAPSFTIEDGSTQQWCEWCGMRYTRKPPTIPTHGNGGTRVFITVGDKAFELGSDEFSVTDGPEF